MVRHIATPLAVAFALVAGACAPAPPVNDPADLAKITTLRNGFITAMNSGDAAAFTNLYTPDGISMPNHEKTLTGRDAIVEGQKGIFGQVSIKVELAADETRGYAAAFAEVQILDGQDADRGIELSCRERRTGDDPRASGVGRHPGEAAVGIVGIEGHVRSSRAEDT